MFIKNSRMMRCKGKQTISQDCRACYILYDITKELFVVSTKGNFAIRNKTVREKKDLQFYAS